MFNPTELFKNRLKNHIKLLNRYLRYIFNGHFMIALMFMIITLAIYYQKWLATISDRFPAHIVIAIMLGLLVSYNPLQLFLKEPDKVFLIAKEAEMYHYFRLTLLYNFVVQLYLVFIVIAAVFPLYARIFPTKTKVAYLFLLIVIFIIKGWNLLANWYMLKVRAKSTRALDKVIRTLLSIALFYSILYEQFVVIISLILFLIFLNSYRLSRKQSGLAWDMLIENDQNRLALFYRFVNMFAEAPQTTKRLKKRRLLALIINKMISFTHRSTYTYLYRLTFIHSSDYLSMYIRLIIVGGVVIFFVPNHWIKILFALLFIYMTNFQMVTLYYHHRTNSWLDLYPIEPFIPKKVFIQWLIQLTFVQIIVFALLFLIWFDFTGLMITFIAGSLFNYLFNYGYVKRKIST